MGRMAGLVMLAFLLPSAALAQEVPMRGPNGRVHAVLDVSSPDSSGRVHKIYPGETEVQPRQTAPDAFPAPAIPQAPTPAFVSVTGGQVQGEAVGDGSYAFRAIPFAAPPVGRLRWAPPQDVMPWSDVRQSHDSAPACLQDDYGWQTDMAAKSSEDCLYLEVRTPSLDPGARKPVIVWFHGGANRAGGGMGTIFSDLGGSGVVIVSVQYRLGVFGFLSHPALTREGNGASGNYALMDQIKALQWVQANIAQFGGDPYNVTLVGHSAGAQDVGLMLVSPLARGLFQKAIEESGTPQFGFAPRTLAQNEAMGVVLAGQFSRHSPDGAAALQDLRRAPARDLQAAGDRLTAPLEDQSFIWDQATIDGYVLPRSPQAIFEAGEAAKVPLLIGVSAQELNQADVATDYNGALKAHFGGEAGLVDRYESGSARLYGDRVIRLSTDIMLRCPASWVAAHMAGPVYLYQLDVDKDGKIHHGSELNYVMNARLAGKSDGDWPPLLDYWTNFAKTGTPNGKGLAAWPAYGPGKRNIEFTTHGAETGAAWRAPVCGMLGRP